MIIDDLACARAIHVLALVHWIGGVAAVTTIASAGPAGNVVPSRELVRQLGAGRRVPSRAAASA